MLDVASVEYACSFVATAGFEFSHRLLFEQPYLILLRVSVPLEPSFGEIALARYCPKCRSSRIRKIKLLFARNTHSINFRRLCAMVECKTCFKILSGRYLNQFICNVQKYFVNAKHRRCKLLNDCRGKKWGGPSDISK